MKRFTETEKWRDPWFQKLDRETRILWVWLCDRVDNSGVVDICWPICNAETGGNFSEESVLLLGERVERLETGKWWIPKFVHFQFGELSAASKVHQSVEKLLLKHSLSDRVSHRVCNTLKEKDKEKDKVKDKDSEPKTSPLKAKPQSFEDVAIHVKEIGYNESGGRAFFDHYESVGWIRGKSPVKDWKACLRTWIGNEQKWAKEKNGSFNAATIKLRPSIL